MHHKDSGTILSYLLIITGMLSPWLKIPNTKIYLFHIIIIISMVYFVCNLQSMKYRRIILGLESNFTKYLLILVMFIIIHTVINYQKNSIKYLIIFFQFIYSLYFIIILNYSNLGFKYKVLRIFTTIIIIAGIIGIIESKTNFRLPCSPYLMRDFSKVSLEKKEYLMTYPTAFYFNPNDLATLLSLAFFMLLGKILYTLRKKETFISLLILFTAISYSKSRLNMFAILIGLVIFFFLNLNIIIRRTKAIKKLNKYVFLIIGVVIIFFFRKPIITFTSTLFSFLKMLTTGDFSNSPFHSTRERWKITVESIKIIISNPFGSGIGSSTYLVAKKLNLREISLHNLLFELTVDLGVIFIFSLLMFYIYLIKYNIAQYLQENNYIEKGINLGFFLANISLIILNFSSSSLIYFLPFWIYVIINILHVIQKQYRGELL